MKVLYQRGFKSRWSFLGSKNIYGIGIFESNRLMPTNGLTKPFVGIISKAFNKDGRGEPNRKYPANSKTPDKYTSYQLYVSDDLINEIVTIGKETLKGLMPYKT